MEREEYDRHSRPRHQVGKVGMKRLDESKSGPQPKRITFRVVYASGEDAEFPSIELNTHSPETRGWQSPPFCEYPQELGLEFLNGEAQLSQLQILSHEKKIATKIDVFVGKGTSYETAEFKRLGHLSLDDNERSGFAARELKSVFIGKQGNFLRLLIHKCHLNKHNIYNQAGIIAINVLGFPANSHSVPSSAQRVTSMGKPVPPLEDLAFDMNFDQQTADTIRQLHHAKEQAVQDEEFELAKELKRAEEQLKHVGMRIAELENAKRDAVHREDYDEAAAIKKEVTAMRNEVARVAAPLLGRQKPAAFSGRGSNNNNEQWRGGYDHGKPLQHAEPTQSTKRWSDSIGSARYDEPDHYSQQQQGYSPSPQVSYNNQSHHQNDFDDQPIPTTRSNSRQNQFFQPSSPAEQSPFHDQPQQSARQVPYGMEDERPLPVHQKSPGPRMSARSAGFGAVGFGEDPSGEFAEQADGYAPATDPQVIKQALGSVDGYEELPEAEPLPAGLGNESQPLVEVFGEYLVRCLYSRQVKLRTAALSALENTLASYDANDVKTFGAFAAVCKMCAADKIANVSLHGLKVLEMVSTKAKTLKRHDLHSLEQLMPILVDRLGNNTNRLRQAAHKTLMRLATLKHIGPQFVIPFVLKQPRQGKTLLWRQLLGRLQVVSELVKDNGVREESGLSCDAVMVFANANNCLSHPHAEVRECMKELVMQLYGAVGEAVMPYLKDLRPKQMEEYQLGFDQIDGAQGRPVRESKAPTETSPGPRHASAAASEPRSARSQKSSGRRSARQGDSGDEYKASESKHQNDVNININVVRDAEERAHHYDEDEEDDETEPFTCQFCSRHDENFTEDALDMHYWKECPMLVSCPQCDQIIEVALLNSHLLSECENKDNHRQCPRCNEAIAAQFFEQHVQRASCLPVKPLEKANRCPLCHKDCKPGEEGWRQHLLLDLCPKNTRTQHL